MERAVQSAPELLPATVLRLWLISVTPLKYMGGAYCEGGAVEGEDYRAAG